MYRAETENGELVAIKVDNYLILIGDWFKKYVKGDYSLHVKWNEIIIRKW